MIYNIYVYITILHASVYHIFILLQIDRCPSKKGVCRSNTFAKAHHYRQRACVEVSFSPRSFMSFGERVPSTRRSQSVWVGGSHQNDCQKHQESTKKSQIRFGNLHVKANASTQPPVDFGVDSCCPVNITVRWLPPPTNDGKLS